MNKCRTKDKKVYPCNALYDVCEGSPNGKGKGLYNLVLTNMITNKFSREFYLVKSGEYKSKGMVLNYCPFCGEQLHFERHPTDVDVSVSLQNTSSKTD